MGENEPPHVDRKEVKAPNPAFFASLLILSLISTGCASIYAPYFTKDPLTAEEHNNLGVIYEREGKFDLAIREYKKAASADGDLIVPLVNLGNVYQKKGETGEAEKYYKKALRKDEHNIEAANNLASLYIETDGNYGEALEILRAAAEAQDPQSAYALDTLGVLYFKTGNIEKAKESLLEACSRAAGEEKLIKEIDSHMEELGDGTVCK
jgi:tetratricopeptide (TPR) repeat protein